MYVFKKKNSLFLTIDKANGKTVFNNLCCRASDKTDTSIYEYRYFKLQLRELRVSRTKLHQPNRLQRGVCFYFAFLQNKTNPIKTILLTNKKTFQHLNTRKPKVINEAQKASSVLTCERLNTHLSKHNCLKTDESCN